MPVYSFEIAIDVVGPFLTQSSSARGYGVDAPLARTGEKEKETAYLPFSLIKGKLLQAWQEIGADKATLEYLGAECGNAENEGSVEAKPGRIHFGDLIHREPEKKNRPLRHRIRIDRKTGCADDGALQVIESPFAAGETIRFSGPVRFYGKAEEAANVRQWIEWGLRWTGSLGAERTNGFGRIAKVEVTPSQSDASTGASAPGSALQFALLPDSPFCLALQRKSGNLFESVSEIPGGVLKGAIARILLLEGNGRMSDPVDSNLGQRVPAYAALCRHFEQVRFTHSLPSQEGSEVRPSRPPLSLVKVSRFPAKGDDFYDVVSRESACLIRELAPQFDIDWKTREDIDERFGWPKRERELRVRTAIQADTLRASDEKLFAYELISPKGLEWLGSADLSRVPSDARAEVAQQLGALLEQGLASFGKTKTSAKVSWKDHRPRFESRKAPIKGEWRISLTTPALLCEASDITRSTGSADELFAAYQKRWSALSKGRLTLKRFFARQSLAGGYYLYRRFQTPGAYQPWLLTNAGSVFVLTGAADCEDLIKDWLAKGLDVPGATWKTCPFIPENGYGEIAVNLELDEFKLPVGEGEVANAL